MGRSSLRRSRCVCGVPTISLSFQLPGWVCLTVAFLSLKVAGFFSFSVNIPSKARASTRLCLAPGCVANECQQGAEVSRHATGDGLTLARTVSHHAERLERAL